MTPRLPESLPEPAPLTLTQARMIAAYTRHDTIKQAAAALGIKPQTAKNRLSDAYAALGVTSIIGAVNALGWFHVPDDDELVAWSMASKRLRAAIDEAQSVLDRLEEPS